jgi:hypothetical protein
MVGNPFWYERYVAECVVSAPGLRPSIIRRSSSQHLTQPIKAPADHVVAAAWQEVTAVSAIAVQRIKGRIREILDLDDSTRTISVQEWLSGHGVDASGSRQRRGLPGRPAVRVLGRIDRDDRIFEHLRSKVLLPCSLTGGRLATHRKSWPPCASKSADALYWELLSPGNLGFF